MVPPHANVDWSTLGILLYNYWMLSAGILGLIAWLYRTRIVRQTRRFFDAIRSARQQSVRVEELTAQRDEAQAKADDWRRRFGEIDERYAALGTEYKRLGDDIVEFKRRMTTAEELVRMLRDDRNELIDFSRLLIGQLFTIGHAADYPIPALKSIITVPGPPLPPYPEATA